MSIPIRLGTRRSALAQAQSGHVATALEKIAGRPVELVPITSEGDTNRASLSEIGGLGIFATRLREALLAGECDFLVHSLKDLPTAIPAGLVIAATPTREDARDVVLTRGGVALHDLAPGSTVGTGSPRRIAQVHRRAPHAEVVDIRGNVDSRLARVASGELDAVILAAAGLSRLDTNTPLQREELGLAEWPTAPGQGSLAVETRADAPADLLAALAELDDWNTRLAITVERAVLEGLDAGCQAPMAAHAVVEEGSIRVRTVVYAPDGSNRIGLDVTEPLSGEYIRRNGSGNGADTADGADPMRAARELGFTLARRLLDQGAAGLVSREHSS
ncbi:MULTISPECIES: hydroxymethylbilane synthase [unclassified Microbacterium]|uniref:hydroxymethylbilane synthase n=1 Tax=unclassified Microbacterium TaxID=2609290 RepID=UPI000EA8CDF1|nr:MULTISPECIES: hydroxymethylbilane synthase [unclassified Microbacterium]MBT2483728.1 hydroxymethylbilane synthase [Microbacterium sp. ISL-108]RKN66722.1 hydroxymethylbilane synthase [Microbacterium sp. CGR2]